MPTKTLTQFIINSAKAKEKDYFISDTKVSGLMLKVTRSGYKSYVFQARTPWHDHPKRKTIGAENKFSLSKARDIAESFNHSIAKGINIFEEPEKTTLHQICEEYLELRRVGNLRVKQIKPKTYKEWRRTIDCYIKGSRISLKDVKEIGVRDADTFLSSFGHIPSQANRLRGFLKLVFKYSVQKGYREEGTNVWDYVDKFRENPKQARFNDEKELQAFLDYMQGAEDGTIKNSLGCDIDKRWVYFIWLCFFTGARPNEILDIKLSYINMEAGFIHFPDTKTGSKDVHISTPAREIIKKCINEFYRHPGNEYLIPGQKGKGRLVTYKRQWNNLRNWIKSDHPNFEATPYSIRRYFALESKKLDRKTTQELMQWKTERMVDHYAGEDEELRQQRYNVVSMHGEKMGKRLLSKRKKD